MVTKVHLIDPDPTIALALERLLSLYSIKLEHIADTQSFLNTQNPDTHEDGLILYTINKSTELSEKILSVEYLVNDSRCTLPVIVLAEDYSESLYKQVLDIGVVDLMRTKLAATYLFSRLQALHVDNDNKGIADKKFILSDGQELTYRLIAPRDSILEKDFVRELSPESRYQRFFSRLQELPPKLLDKFTHIQFPNSFAVIATIEIKGKEKQIGEARYAPTNEDGVVEFAVVVADKWHGNGIATQLMHLLIMAAATGGSIQRIDGEILETNTAMRRLADKVGFKVVRHNSDHPRTVTVTKPIQAHHSN